MFTKLLSGALIAGGAAGLFAAALHFALLQDQLLLAEQYESGELSHFAMPAADHDHGAEVADHDHAAEHSDGHSHDEADNPPLMRNAYTVAFNVLIYVAYAVLLTAGFAVAQANGRKIGPTEGIIWGLCGFITFQLAPAIGLAPNLPGSMAADITARQTWWWATAISTAAGLGLFGYGRSIATAVLAVILVLGPHVIGAPQADGFGGLVPPELSAAFAARVLGVGLASWVFMGWLAGKLWAEAPEK